MADEGGIRKLRQEKNMIEKKRVKGMKGEKRREKYQRGLEPD